MRATSAVGAPAPRPRAPSPRLESRSPASHHQVSLRPRLCVRRLRPLATLWLLPLLLTSIPAMGGGIGTLGPGRGRVVAFDLVYGTGTGVSRSNDGRSPRASQLFARFEGGGFIKSSRIGNLAGIEAGAQIGYDGIQKRHSRLFADYIGDMGMDADIWVGFPVTLMDFGDGKEDWLRWSIAPGLGSSLVSGYFYLKSTLALRLPVVGDGDIAATWWPDAASNVYGGTRDTRNSAALKLSLYRRSGLHLFMQYQRTQYVTPVGPPNDDPNVYGGLSKPPGMDSEPFALESRVDADSVVTFGVGWTPNFKRKD